MIFKDRKDAGIRLAEKLKKYQDEETVIFALPRGGVVLGVEIANKLASPLDLIITKKIGHPINPEYAIAAVAEEGEPECNLAEVSHVDPIWFENEVRRVQNEIKRRREMYMGKIKPSPVEGKTAIIVDDGIATGFTMMAAINEIKKRKPQKLVVAIPVIPHDTAQNLRLMADDLVSLDIAYDFLGSVGSYYENFDQIEDSEVILLLDSVKNKIEIRNNLDIRK